MKFKPSGKTGNVVLELDRDEAQLPAIPLAEVRLNRILVPIDFSECSHKALRYAASFAKQFSAEVLLLHVVELILPPPELVIVASGPVDMRLREEAAKKLSEWRQQIVAHASVKAVIRDGTPYREIVRAADENNIDLIILGTHGRIGIAHVFIGSTAERVARHAMCPVMVVREREHDFIEESAAKAPVRKRFQLKGKRYGNSVEKKRSGKSAAVLRR